MEAEDSEINLWKNFILDEENANNGLPKKGHTRDPKNSQWRPKILK
jgi:hypothetical protein